MKLLKPPKRVARVHVSFASFALARRLSDTGDDDDDDLGWNSELRGTSLRAIVWQLSDGGGL